MVIRPWFCGLRFATSASTLSALSVWPIDLSRLMYWSASLALPGSASQRLAAAAVCLSEIVPVDPVRSGSLLIVWHPASGSAASTRRLAPAISCRRERLPAPRVDFIMNNSRKQTPINVAVISSPTYLNKRLTINGTAAHRENLCTFCSSGLVSAAISLGFSHDQIASADDDQARHPHPLCRCRWLGKPRRRTRSGATRRCPRAGVFG